MKIKDTIVELEKEALDQWSNGNPGGYVQNGAIDMTYVDDIGAHDLIIGLDHITQYAQSLKEMIPPHKYEMAGTKVQQFGDTAILSYQYHPFTLEGQPQTKWRTTVVYALLDGVWKIVHANWTMMKNQNP